MIRMILSSVLTFFLLGVLTLSSVAEEYRLDFNDPEMAAAIKACYQAKVEDGVLHIDIPKGSKSKTRMVNFPLQSLMKQFCGYFVEVEADICFSDVPEPSKGYFGVKFQFHLPGAPGDAWPGVLRFKGNYPIHGTSDWFHSRAKSEWSNTITNAFLQVGLQEVTGHIAVKNIVLRRGRPCPVSTLRLPVIPRAVYSGEQPPRMRGAMSPNTSNGPKEQDFADLEKWGANLIRWQMGLPALQNAADLRNSLKGRFQQLETVLELAKRYHLYVVIDVHTMKESRPVVLGTPEGRDELVRFWVEIAKKFKGNPNIFGYNLMNEPVSGNIEADGPSLNEQYHRLIKAIREVDPQTPIILDCDKAGVPDMLEYLEVFPYDNIIYSPHMYKPFELTHQLNQKQETYLSYPNEKKGWNKEFLRKELAGVREFQLKTGARIYVGEFSCIRWAPGAENYIRDCIDIFEEYGWDWSYHAFREWQGWSVESTGSPVHPEHSDSNPRRDALLQGFGKNN
ncbi:MAG: cellulase family glycosylhydrolase [Planctomycetia bacterium]|nr:cellulase family glycosylhydrolase [Planctomycetia bacterium]